MTPPDAVNNPPEPLTPRPDLGGAAAVEVETDIPAGDPDDIPEGGAGGLYGDGGGEFPPPGRRNRARSPLRAHVNWLDVSLPPELLFWLQGWLAAHPTLTVETPDGAVLEVNALTLPLEQQWELCVRDVFTRDVIADGSRDTPQYDFGGWLSRVVPIHLREAVLRESNAELGRLEVGLRAQYAALIRRLLDHKVPREDLQLMLRQVEGGSD